MKAFAAKLSAWYQTAALTFVNVIVIFVLVNLAAQLALDIQQRARISLPPAVADNNHTFSSAAFKKAYPGYSLREINKILDETWSRPLVYDPFTQFKEDAFQGEYVRVYAQGFRHTAGQGAWPPEQDKLNVFLLGGSTTFGYGVTDHETIASYLQPLLSEKTGREVRVYNFGRGYYYSRQELILLEQLLLQGFRPDIAIFIDGINEFHPLNKKPFFSEQLRRFMSKEVGIRKTHCFIQAVRKLPVLRLIQSLTDVPGEPKELKTSADLTDPRERLDLVDSRINRYLQNKQLCPDGRSG